MKKIEPISFKGYSQETEKVEKSPKDIVIFNFDNQNPVGDKKQPYEVKFDKDGYPIPDEERLVLHEAEDVPILFGLFKVHKDAEYAYVADGKEQIWKIKDKFHLKDGAINKCNKNIKSDNYQPSKGTVIYFMKDDIDTQRK